MPIYEYTCNECGKLSSKFTSKLCALSVIHYYCAKHPCSLCEKVGFSVCLYVCMYGFSASFVGAEKTWAHVLLSTQSLKSELLRNPSLISLASRIWTFWDPLFKHFWKLCENSKINIVLGIFSGGGGVSHMI